MAITYLDGEFSGLFSIDIANLVSQFEKLGSVSVVCTAILTGDMSPSVPLKGSITQGTRARATLTGGAYVIAYMKGSYIARSRTNNPLIKYRGNRLKTSCPSNIMSYTRMSQKPSSYAGV